jgi:hypothetical protein
VPAFFPTLREVAMKLLTIKPVKCGFCLLTIDINSEGPKGIAGKDGFICLECLALAKKILDESRKVEKPTQGA